MDKQRLISRRDETAAIEVFLDQVGPRALLLEGEPGIGKTSVWTAGVEAARERGATVLAASASGAEVRLSFAGLSDILDHLPASVFASLPGPQQRALDAALLRQDTLTGPVDGRAVGQALLGVFRTLAAGRTVVVAIDDLQWLDAPSGRAVMFALRRLVDEQVALLAAARMGAQEPPPLDLERVVPGGRLQRVRLGPLGDGALDELLREQLGLNLSRSALLGLRERTGGNPFFALEIGRLLEGGRIEATDELPLPRSLRDLVHERLKRLPVNTRRVLLTAASLSQPRLGLLGRRAAADLRPAIDAGIVTVEGEEVVFTHPLLAFVPYEEASPATRRRVHRRLARAVVDPEERARHLALAAVEPDERVATELDEAARRALARGAPDAAAELARLARELTPGGSIERLLAEAEYTFESGDSARARALMEEAVSRLDAGPRRAHAITRLAWFRGCWGDDPHGALALADGAVEQARGDLAVESEVYEFLTWQCQFVGRHDDAVRYARLGGAAAEQLGDRQWIVLLGMAAALAEGRVGRSGAARAAVARLEELDDAASNLRVINNPAWVRAIFLASDGELQGALTLMRGLHERALERGDESSLPSLLETRTLIEFRAGNWLQADELLDVASELAVRTDQENQRLSLQAWRAFLDAHLGRVESARAGAERAITAAAERQLSVYQDVGRWTLMLLELASDHPADALSEFRRLLHPERGIGEPHPFFRQYGDLAEALAALGEADAAAAVVRRWRARATALDHAVAGPGGDRCVGLSASAVGDVDRGLRLLDRAVARGRALPEPFELGRSLLALGTCQRRARKKRLAASTLKEALDLFERLPAPLWANRARRELARIGGRPVADGALTETERQVMELVVAGRSNAQVARELIVSTKTVEWNLSKVYRKLGVRSRAELAARVAGQI